MKKIFKVLVEYETVIYAADAKEAEEEAKYVVDYMDEEPIMVSAEEILSVDDLPEPWDKDCIPWNSERDLTVNEILKINE